MWRICFCDFHNSEPSRIERKDLWLLQIFHRHLCDEHVGLCRLISRKLLKIYSVFCLNVLLEMHYYYCVVGCKFYLIILQM